MKSVSNSTNTNTTTTTTASSSNQNNNDPPQAATAPLNEALFLQRLQRIPLFSPNMSEDDFFRCLSTFLSLFGFPLYRFPSIQGKLIPMKYLFLVVLSQGGFEKVTFFFDSLTY
jgi:hypothetical protein